MGSVYEYEEYEGWWHEFRHRACPPKGNRRYVRVKATPGYKPEDEAIFDL
jgi:hypothetical protein